MRASCLCFDSVKLCVKVLVPRMATTTTMMMIFGTFDTFKIIFALNKQLRKVIVQFGVKYFFLNEFFVILYT
jgi:hypothetical protein